MTLVRITFFILLLVCQFNWASGQKQPIIPRIMNWMLNDTSSNENPKFIAYPTVAYAPETKWEFGVSSILVFYANRDITNRISEVNAFSFITLENQYGLWVDHAIYSDQSKWFFLGKIRAQQYPLLYFGQGPSTSGEALAEINAGSLNIRERILRQVKGNWYLGLETDFQRLSNVTANDLSSQPYPTPKGLSQYTNLGVGLGVVYDNRHNVLNVREGFFGETGFLRYANSLGSDFQFTSYFFDVRHFKPVTKHQVLATQLYFSQMEGDVPFNQLSLMGGENLMRGYYLGRYRDNALMAGQVEYRFLPFPFSKRWGGAAFLGTGTVGERVIDLHLDKLKLTGGLGVRFLIFQSKDIFTRFDVAFTEDGPGYYFFIGEAF